MPLSPVRTFLALVAPLILAPLPSWADLSYFGYSAVLCDLDDPHDDSRKSDYVDEVAGFTNINHVCLTGDVQQNGQRLQRAARHFTPFLDVSPIFFEISRGRLVPNKNTDFFVQFLQDTIQASQVSPEKFVFYLADEPALRGLSTQDVSNAAALLKSLYPETPIAVIEAYHSEGPPAIPEAVDYWGFNAYAIPDPAAEPLYTAYLNAAARKLAPHQSLIMVMDGNYTPYHRNAGLTEDAMADVARAYFEYAVQRADVTMLLTYTWAGGIDNIDERGTRDLSPTVIETHRWIGRQIIGSQRD